MISYDQLDTHQREVVDRGCDFVGSNKLFAVHGVAGSGKTTLMQHIFNNATAMGHTPVLAAPTGKAARRMKEATGIAAKTIHQLLEFPRPGEQDETTGKYALEPLPKRNSQNPLVENVILIDEGSMLTNQLYLQLIEAMRNDGFLRIFGDLNQLKPIEKNDAHLMDGYETPFRKAWKRNGMSLEAIYRQQEGSGILFNAERVLKGFTPMPKEDFAVVSSFDQSHTLKQIIRTAPEFATLSAQVIVPQNKGKFGTYALNMLLQEEFNPKPVKSITVDRYQWHPMYKTGCTFGTGDKVIMTKNWYIIPPFGVMNGETGILVDIYDDGTLLIDFGYDDPIAVPTTVEGTDRRGRPVMLFPQYDIELAYVINTHKAQGSEYDRVVYLLDRSHIFMLCRANTYTAITRARKRVDLVMKPECLGPMLAVKSRSESKKNA